MPEPFRIYNSIGGNPFRTDRDRDQFCAWAREQGINPDKTYRVELHESGDNLTARIFEIWADGDPEPKLPGPDTNSFPRRAPYDVPLTSLPPAPEGTP